MLQPSALSSSAAHSLRFSDGKTALKLAIDYKQDAVAAYLTAVAPR